MKQAILDFPKQFKIGLDVAKKVFPIKKQRFSNLVICGVGGSALPGDILLDAMPDFPLYTYIYRDYGLPPQANKQSLIIAISYSGNTEETISAYETAIAKNYSVIAMTTGGQLQQMAQSRKMPLVLIPQTGIQPRCATGYLFAAILQILCNAGIIKDHSNKLLQMAKNLSPKTLEIQGQELAKKLFNQIPIVYSSNSFKSLARIWKIKFNENSKVLAFWNFFPELNHNEMVGYTIQKSKIKNQNENSKCKNFHAVILQDKNDNPRILKRMMLTANLMEESGAKIEFVEIKGKDTLEKIFNNLLLGDWASYYLALAYKIDPEPVKIVEEFKKRLTE